MPPPPPFNAAILVLSPGTSPLDTAFKSAFHSNITRASASLGLNAKIDFFDPIVAQVYPEPGAYDLIVLTGGGGDLDADVRDVDWIEKLKEFVRGVELTRGQKVVGVCWGHQVVHVAFGGAVGAVKNGGCEIGVYDVMLTRAGGRLFESVGPTREKVKIHQFHEREVKVPGRDFVTLAEDNQCLMNRANTILTFQGHPEMDAELSHLLFKETKEAGLGEEEREALRRKIEGEHDGQEVWKTIVRWASNV